MEVQIISVVELNFGGPNHTTSFFSGKKYLYLPLFFPMFMFVTQYLQAIYGCACAFLKILFK